MKVTNDIKYIGVNDKAIDLFEGQYVVPNGMSYNSYIILDDKIAVMDTIDQHFGDEWLNNIETVLNGRKPDYLVVHHMEPDHSANIDTFMQRYPEATIVSSAQAFMMMKNFFGTDYSERRVVVKEGSALELGKHTLNFVAAPMVHWPEVIMSYDSCDKVLFSADGFGKFGALDADEPWDDEARRYYIGIVGKYGVQVQAVLKKAANLDIEVIAPLHGPVLTEDLGHYIGLYDTWSKYEAETDGILIAYTSVYGNTRKAALLLESILKEKGANAVAMDLARSDMSKAIENAFRYKTVVFATTTYNAEIFPFMQQLLHGLVERNFQNRRIGIIENGSWAPTAAKVIKKNLETCKNLEFMNTTVTIKSALNADSEAAIKALAEELA